MQPAAMIWSNAAADFMQDYRQSEGKETQRQTQLVVSFKHLFHRTRVTSGLTDSHRYTLLLLLLLLLLLHDNKAQ